VLLQAHDVGINWQKALHSNFTSDSLFVSSVESQIYDPFKQPKSHSHSHPSDIGLGAMSDPRLSYQSNAKVSVKSARLNWRHNQNQTRDGKRKRKAAGRACLWLLTGRLLRRPVHGRITLPRLCSKFKLSILIPRLLLFDLGLFDVSILSLQGKG
jgi:hypothetical protein